MPAAFVIMPFGAAFDPVYDGFIRPALEEVGYAVQRADDIQSQRNILHDIVEAIQACDLVVADLTDNNPNVFYELGLAHALNKPVVLLTQSVEDVPFDLHAYRLLGYSTHFLEIEHARRSLRDYGLGQINGTVRFSNPVNDFLRNGREHVKIITDRHAAGQVEDDLGFIDHMELMENGFAKTTQIITRVGELTARFGEDVDNATARINRVKSSRQSVPYAHLRRIADALSNTVETYTIEMRSLNEQYTQTARESENSLEFLINYHVLDTNEEREQLRSLMETLTLVQQQGNNSLVSYRKLADVMQATPQFERNLTRSLRAASVESRKMADNMEITLASMARAEDSARKLLARDDQDESIVV